MSEINTTIEQISTLVDTLSTQCSLLNKDESKEEIANIKLQIRKLEGRLSAILPDAKVPIGLNGKGDKLDRLKARAARFGCENDEVKKVTETEKLSKRKERFNTDDSSAASGGTDDAKKRRLARFGGQ